LPVKVPGALSATVSRLLTRTLMLKLPSKSTLGVKIAIPV
jgi:hypothetical protein